ncbi:sporulation integral membrane protein YtvI [Bacillus massiliglaciei]|uniref:sporulation integral membrane protein YtvI n=1 Tax=Bacillus massiliglaciei TaxID=1816693 RepID=UPI000A678C3A|nr:sporulation integral membrane protein YtvI [Bacillus massiliglaciei]
MDRSNIIRWAWIITIVLVSILLIPFSLVLIFAFFTALMLDRLVAFLCKRGGLSRIWAVLGSFLIFIGGAAGLLYFSVSVLVKQILVFSDKLPAILRELYTGTLLPAIKRWEYYSEAMPANVMKSVENAAERGINSLEGLAQNIVESILQMAASVPGLFIDILIYLIALFLFSLELPVIKKGIRQMFREATYQKIMMVYKDLMKAAMGFLKAQILLSLITFILALAGLMILHIPYPMIWSLVIVCVDILPILGTGSVLVPWALFLFFQGSEHLAIGLIILFFIITVTRRVIEPKVYSANLGLTPLASLISLYVGFKLLGFFGLFIGPAFVIIFETLKRAGIIKFQVKI